uniref:Uncharacterized protein n=1 Tax=Eutreptiella gymnastica TaxID=73025 RepID=A0A7S1NN54_9EUGL
MRKFRDTALFAGGCLLAPKSTTPTETDNGMKPAFVLHTPAQQPVPHMSSNYFLQQNFDKVQAKRPGALRVCISLGAHVHLIDKFRRQELNPRQPPRHQIRTAQTIK